MDMQHTKGPWQVFDNRDDPEDVTCDEALIGVTPAGELHDVAYCYIDTDRSEDEILANAKLIAAAPEMFAILDDLEGSFDKEIYPEQKKEDFDAPDDREYTVTITAKQWRALGRALGKANGAA